MLSNSSVAPAGEIERLRALLSDSKAALPLDWRLSPTEEAVFRALLARDIATPAVIVEVAGVASAQSARVHMHRIRQKLAPRNVEIETLHGKGWRLIGREQWRAILAAKTEGVN